MLRHYNIELYTRIPNLKIYNASITRTDWIFVDIALGGPPIGRDDLIKATVEENLTLV